MQIHLPLPVQIAIILLQMRSSSWKGDESVLACQPAITDSAAACVPTRYVVTSNFHIKCVLCTSRLVQAASLGDTWERSPNKQRKYDLFI